MITYCINNYIDNSTTVAVNQIKHACENTSVGENEQKGNTNNVERDFVGEKGLKVTARVMILSMIRQSLLKMFTTLGVLLISV